MCVRGRMRHPPAVTACFVSCGSPARTERSSIVGYNQTVVAIVTCATLTLCSARVQAQAPAFTIDGNVALRTMEQLMAKLREVLAKSTNPTRRQQLTGWKVMRIKNPLPDGNVAYVHVINPVIPGAGYTIMQTLYDEF